MPPMGFPPPGEDFLQKPQTEGPAPLLHASPPEIHRVGVLLESFLLQILAHLSFYSELPHLPPPGPSPDVPSMCAARQFHPPPPERQGFAAGGYLQQHVAPSPAPPPWCVRLTLFLTVTSHKTFRIKQCLAKKQKQKKRPILPMDSHDSR